MQVVNRGVKDGWGRIAVTLDPQEAAMDVSQYYMMLAMEHNIHPKADMKVDAIVREALGDDLVDNFIVDNIMRRYVALALDQAGAKLVGEPRYGAKDAFHFGVPFEFDIAYVDKPAMALNDYGPVQIGAEELPDVAETVQAQMEATLAGIIGDCSAEEITDQWVAAHVPPYETLAGLEEALLQEITKEQTENALGYRNYLVATRLAERIQGDVPDLAYEANYEATLRDFQRELAESNMTVEGFCQERGLTQAQMEEELSLRSDEKLRQGLALDALARHCNLRVEKADMKAFCGAIAPGNEKSFERSIRENGGMHRAEEQALRMKANQWAVDQSVIMGAEEAAE